MHERFRVRRDKLRRMVQKAGAEAILVTDFTNVTYLTNFTGDDSFLLVRHDGEVMLSDGRYKVQLGDECPGMELHIRRPGVNMFQAVKKVLRASRLHRLAIEADSMTVSLREQIAAEVPHLQLVATRGLVERLRQVKDRYELSEIRRAIRYAEKAFDVLRASLRPDKTEKQLSDEMEWYLRQLGAKASSFPTIVAAGARAALPHATVTRYPIGGCDFVLVDWGADGGLYKSDLTRILVTGTISPKLERVYGVLRLFRV